MNSTVSYFIVERAMRVFEEGVDSKKLRAVAIFAD